MLQKFFQNGPLMIALAAMLGLIAIGPLRVIWRLRERIGQLEQERDNLALRVEDAKQRDYVDKKTGIPNEKKMEEDILRFCREVEERKIPSFVSYKLTLKILTKSTRLRLQERAMLRSEPLLKLCTGPCVETSIFFVARLGEMNSFFCLRDQRPSLWVLFDVCYTI